MHRLVLAMSGLVMSGLVLSCGAAAAQSAAPASTHAVLPPGAGRDLMIQTCSKCHTPDVAAEQQLDAAGWKELVNQMANNGAKGSDADFAQITAYLAKAFPAK